MQRYIKLSGIVLMFLLILSSPGFSQTQSEQLTITTYYPSPFGSYRQLQVTDTTTVAGTAFTVSKTGASGGTNIGGSFSASGGANNYGLIVATGNVGIGIVTPGVPLHIVTPGVVANFDRNIAAAGTIISLSRLGTVEGSIDVAGPNVTYNGFTGSHFGWSSEKTTFKMGELLIATGENKTTHNREFSKGETVYGVARTDIPNDKRVFGVYGGETELGDDKWYAINAVGDGFILVTDTNGNIELGDYLTSSVHAGYAQKQDEDVLKNYTVGKAMQNVRWADEKVDPELGSKWKLIACTFKAG